MRSLCSIVLAALFAATTGCAGRTPNPVPMYSPGDTGLSCDGLRLQMGFCQQQIVTLLPKSDKTASNVALGIAGAFLIFPWFFMDFSEADRVEVDAWRARYNYLASLYVDRGCGERMPMPTLKQLRSDKALREKWILQVESDEQFVSDQTGRGTDQPD